MSRKSSSFVRPFFDTGHLSTFQAPRSAQSASSPAISYPAGHNSTPSSAAPSPLRDAHSQPSDRLSQSSALSTARSDLSSAALIQKILTDEHVVAAQNISEVANRRDISILKLSEMCCLLRADLDSLERENAHLSAKLGVCDADSQQQRLQIGNMLQREALFRQSESQHSKLQGEFAELRAREQALALSLKEAEHEREQTSHQLSQCMQQTAIANESARHASILMKAMESDLMTSERARQVLQDSATASAGERDRLRQELQRVLQELEVFRGLNIQNTAQIELFKKQIADSQESWSRSDSALSQLRLELQSQQQLSEELRSQLQSAQLRALAKEEEHNSILSIQKEDVVALRSQLNSSQSLSKQQQIEISKLTLTSNAAQSKCKELQSKIESLEMSHADMSVALQAEISSNARCTAENRDLRTAFESQSSQQRDLFEREMATLQSQLESIQQQSDACATLCSSQQQTMHAMTQKIELNRTERAAMEVQLDSVRSCVQKQEAAYSDLNQKSQTQISQLTSELSESHIKINELQIAISGMTSRYNDLSGALSKATSDFEFKDSDFKAAMKQARTKALKQEELYSKLQDQYVLFQQETSETSARLQQQLLASEHNAASKASRILALEDALTALREATSEARNTIPLLQSKLSTLNEENSYLRSQMLSLSLASESTCQHEELENKDMVHKLQEEVKEKSIQLAVAQQAYEHRLKSAQETIDQQNCELQRIRKLSVRSDDMISVASLLPSHSSRLGSALGTLKGQVIALRQSFNDEIQALWMSVGKSMEAILSIANSESARNKAQITQLHHDIAVMNTHNSELEGAMSKDAAVYEAAEAALIFERVRWETKIFELQDCLRNAENDISTLNATIQELKDSLNIVNQQLSAQRLRTAGILATLCPLFQPNDHVLSTMTDGLCPNIFALRLCSRICSEHNPEFSAALLSHFDWITSDSEGSTAIQASAFQDSAVKLRQATVAPTITLSLQLLYNSIQEAIISKSRSTSDFQARLQNFNLTTTNSEAKTLSLKQRVAELKAQLQEQCSSSTALSVESASVSCSTHFLFVNYPSQLKQQLHELELRLDRQAAQFAADTLLQKQMNQQVLAAHELQASNALSLLQEKLVQVHTELAKLRLKNRDEYARVRADARTAYEQRIQEVTNDSLADSSFLASFIESSLAEALSLEQSTLNLKSSMHFDKKM